MNKSTFLVGAATAAHQVEGNNIHSDMWALEQLDHSMFTEPSLNCVDHYNKFKEDIDLLKQANLNAYRFTIEWARIEPQEGQFNESEMNHYLNVIDYCNKNEIEPIVTLHHFSSPKWVIEKGGFETEEIISYFVRYTRFVVGHLGDTVHYISTINEANMGLQLADIMKHHMRQFSDAQVGFQMPKEYILAQEEASRTFGGIKQINHFLSPRTEKGDEIICQMHVQARSAIKQINPKINVGLTLSLHDLQCIDGGEKLLESEWEKEFLHYLPYIQEDDFFGLQNYTRKVFDSNGSLPPDGSYPLSQMGYEIYPDALEHVLRKVRKELLLPILVTENGLGTDSDPNRVEFIHTAMSGVQNCIKDGIPVIGYIHWSLLDNFEWMLGYSRTFGLISVDRITQSRQPKRSLYELGTYNMRSGDLE